MSLEIINGPLELYWAPIGEAFPAINVAPAGNWSLIGSSGSNNYTEDGVTLAFDKNFEVFRGLGNSYPLKAFLTENEAFVRVAIADLSLDQLRLAFNLNAVGVDAGPPAIQTLDLNVDTDLNEMALLVRGEGKSPEFATGNLQFELNRVVDTGSHELVFVKGNAAAINLEFRILLDTSGGFPGEVGRVVVQTA